MIKSFIKRIRIISYWCYLLLLVVFLRDIYERMLSINDADKKQSIFHNKIKNKLW